MASDGWQQLHPLSPLVNLLPRLASVARSAWPIIPAVLLGRSQSAPFDGLRWFDALLLLLPLGVAAAGATLHWATLRWRVVSGRLEIRTGLFTRQIRVIPADRVQHVASIQRLTHRLTGLVELELETAAGREVEGLLSALSRADAEQLVAGLGRGGTAVPDRRAYANDLGDLFAYGATGTQWGLAIAGLGIAYEIAQWQDPEWIESLALTLGWLGASAALIAALSGTWLFSTLVAVVRHWGFVLIERGQSLVAEEGLLTRRRVEIRPGKVQLVSIHASWFRRLVGIETLVIATAAARSRGGGTAKAEALVPVVAPEQVGTLLQKVLPNIPPDWEGMPRNPADPRARNRALGLAMLRAALFGGLITTLAWPWGALSLLGIPLAGWVAALGFRAQRWLVTPEFILAEGGWWRRDRVVVPRAKVQGVWVRAGILLQRRGLAQLMVAVAGGQVSLPVLDAALAAQLAKQLIDLPRPPRKAPPKVGAETGSPPPPPEASSPPAPPEPPA